MMPRLPIWLRLIFLFVALQALELVVVFFQPTLVQLLVPWPATPLNARFIAALYVSLGFGVLLCAFARSFRAVRIVLLGIGLSTAILFFLTLPHLGELNPFPFWWMLFYFVDPLLVAFTFWKFRWQNEGRGVRNPFAFVWFANAALLAAAGLFLLLLPRSAIAVWPWSVTEPLAQLYSAFFLTLAVASVLAAREPGFEGTQLPSVMIFILAALVLAVSLLHLDRFKPGVSTTLWFTLFSVEALVFAFILIRQRGYSSIQGATA
jgi:hypothetical protein